MGIELEDLYDIDYIHLKRTSADKAPTCTRGKQLLDLCISARLRILNGRILGDSTGTFTCHQPKGSSVVDYVITSEDNISNIPYVEVFDYNGSISDHCCISSALLKV